MRMVLLVLALGCLPIESPAAPSTTSAKATPYVWPTQTPLPPARRLCEVLRIGSGGILQLPADEEVKLLGVRVPTYISHDAVANEYHSTETLHFLQKVCEGKLIRIYYDERQTDVSGRTLAYVYLQDGTFLNAELLRQGYATLDKSHPFESVQEFTSYAQEAKAAKRGLWAGPDPEEQARRIAAIPFMERMGAFTPVARAPGATPRKAPTPHPLSAINPLTGKQFEWSGREYITTFTVLHRGTEETTNMLREVTKLKAKWSDGRESIWQSSKTGPPRKPTAPRKR
ncbi:MAG: thermonuclease family protein [Candidatus Sumerlaeaceae bacterium]